MITQNSRLRQQRNAADNGTRGKSGRNAASQSESAEKNSKVVQSVFREPRASMAKSAPTSGKEEALRVMFLGGVGEIGKNMTALEFGDDIIIVDCGDTFPGGDMPGVDLVIPDVTYLSANKERVRGIVLTHGHEDHIGALPYVLKELNVPVYGTKLTLAILDAKLREQKMENSVKDRKSVV